MEKTHTAIAQAISKKKPGSLIVPSDFRGTGTSMAVKKALSRIAKTNQIKRLAVGIYYIPKIDRVLGELKPDTDTVIQMIADKEKIRLRPSGAYVLNQLGLTTQVPAKRVYLTDGNPRKFMIGKLQIRFKPTTSKKLSLKGKMSSLVIQALEELNLDEIDEISRMKLKDLLLKENTKLLKHDLQIASVKVSNFIHALLKVQSNDRMAKFIG